MAGNTALLANTLATALGWEEQAVEPIVEAIASVQSDEHLEELVQVSQEGRASFLLQSNSQLACRSSGHCCRGI